MTEATEKKESKTTRSELDVPQWSVVSFDAVEGSGLTYPDAAKLLTERETAGVYGLCIITDDAAHRMAAAR